MMAGAYLLLAFRLSAGQTPLVASGFDHFYNLEYPEAIVDFDRAIAQDPNNPQLHNHLAQSLLFQEMFRNGALESEMVSGNNAFLRRPKMNPDPATEKRFLDEIAKSMSLAQARLAKNPNDAFALYAMCVAYGLRANYFWIVKKSWRDSLHDATTARHFDDRVLQLEPNNVDARLVEGLDDYIVGSLPWHWRTLGFLIGFKGDKEKGLRLVKDVAEHGENNKYDAQTLLSALYRRENKPAAAIPLLDDLIARFPRNYLMRLELSQMYSMAGDKTRAMNAVEEVARLKRSDAPGFAHVQWEKIYFQEGVIQFWYRDFDQALENLKKVAAAANEVDLNTGVYAYLRIGQIYDIKGQRALAVAEYQKTIQYAPESDAAVEAKKCLAMPYRRASRKPLFGRAISEEGAANVSRLHYSRAFLAAGGGAGLCLAAGQRHRLLP
jgi:tetratricopeptide (TPR) repeat protein